MKLGKLMVLVLAAGGCGASAKMQAAKSSAYQGEFEEVWKGVVRAVREDFPIVQEVDRETRRITTCWRPIQKENLENWFLFRAVIEVSPEPPYRVSVSGRAAEYRAPQLYPIKHGDVMEPGWVGGRVDRVVMQIHDQLASMAVTAPGSAPPASDPGNPQNVADTCVLRAGELGIASNSMMSGIAIGDPGGLGATPLK